jgi:hypothetical protein
MIDDAKNWSAPLPASMLMQVMNRWKEASVTVRPGTSPDKIEQFEKKNSCRLPADFASFFLAIDGMNLNEMDNALMRFWPLGELRTALEELPSGDGYAGFYLFADYSMWAHAYAIRLGTAPPNEVVLVGGKLPIQKAASFTEFLKDYLDGKVP